MKRPTRSSMKRMNSKVRCGSVSHGSLAKSPHELTKTPRLRKQLQRLLKLREDLAREVYQLRAEACEEIPNYGLHMADAATDSFDRDLVLGLASFEQEGLYEIDAALKRMEDGTYGICELTGKPIAWERLKAIPWTRFCSRPKTNSSGTGTLTLVDSAPFGRLKRNHTTHQTILLTRKVYSPQIRIRFRLIFERNLKLGQKITVVCQAASRTDKLERTTSHTPSLRRRRPFTVSQSSDEISPVAQIS